MKNIMQTWTLIFIVFIGFISVIYPQTAVDLVQGTTGMSSVTYYELLREAARHFQERRYAEAAENYKRLTAAYPFDGETWRRLGVSLYQTQKYREAANAYVKADELGVSPYPQTNAAGAALAFARAGENELALDWLEKAILKYRHENEILLKNNAFAALRQNPRFLKLAPPTAADTISRAEGWRADVDYLLTSMRRFRPEFYGQKRELPNNLVQAAESLKARIPKLTDLEIAVELQKLVARLGGSHTGVNIQRLPEKFGSFNLLPLTFYLFPEGVYIVNSSDENLRSLIGAKVTEIDKMPMEKVFGVLRPLKQTNEGEEHRWFDVEIMTAPNLLQVLGISRKSNEVNLTVAEQNGRSQTVKVGTSANAKPQNRLIPSPISAAPAPLYLSRGNEFYWFEPLIEQSGVYVNFSRAIPKEKGESIAEFGQRLRKFLDENRNVKNLIVDVRNNSGGNTFLYPELLRTIIAFDAQPEKRVFVIIGRSTGSAAMNFAIDLDRLTNAIFVGEATSASVRQNGNPVSLKLPFSGLDFWLSTVEWNISSPGDERRWIAPDVPVVLTAKDYFVNRDPVMEAITTLIGQ
jgi:tetratricopeptide (TPR) repeat protein